MKITLALRKIRRLTTMTASTKTRVMVEVNGDKVDVKEEEAEKLGFAGPCLMGKKKKEKKTLKRPKKEKEEAVPWDCNECTYQNKAEVAKLEKIILFC